MPGKYSLSALICRSRSTSPLLLTVTFLACPRKVSKEGHPTKILHGVLSRPQYISETRPAGSDSPKCLTLGLGRTPKFSNGSKATKLWLYPDPARSRSGPYDIFGHPSWPKEASHRANAHCLRPQAEFARSSGRGLRQVKNFIKDAKGMCKK